MKKKALFIINPVSGGKNKSQVPVLIAKHLDHSVYDHDIIYSTLQHTIRAIALEAAARYDVIVAVGGDGTVNETASAIAGTDKILGIIPFGSGNGLARFLGIPLNTAGAIQNLNTANVKVMDAGKMNGRWFFNMAGMGFDAHISEVFSRDKNRGFRAYLKSSFEEISRYKPQKYNLEIDGRRMEREAFMVSFANSSQYGNNAHISPGASLHDGLIDVCVIKAFPTWRLIEMGFRMLTKTAESSGYVEIIRGKHVQIKRAEPGPIHLDGEPEIIGSDAEIKVVPGALNIIAGENYRG